MVGPTGTASVRDGSKQVHLTQYMLQLCRAALEDGVVPPTAARAQLQSDDLSVTVNVTELSEHAAGGPGGPPPVRAHARRLPQPRAPHGDARRMRARVGALGPADARRERAA